MFPELAEAVKAGDIEAERPRFSSSVVLLPLSNLWFAVVHSMHVHPSACSEGETP